MLTWGVLSIVVPVAHVVDHESANHEHRPDGIIADDNGAPGRDIVSWTREVLQWELAVACGPGALDVLAAAVEHTHGETRHIHTRRTVSTSSHAPSGDDGPCAEGEVESLLEAARHEAPDTSPSPDAPLQHAQGAGHFLAAFAAPHLPFVLLRALPEAREAQVIATEIGSPPTKTPLAPQSARGPPRAFG